MQKSFKIYTGTGDIYTYFFEQGYRILCNRGILSFITSNKYERAGYGKPLRGFLIENTKIHSYIDLNRIKDFDSVSVDVSILNFEKSKPNLGSTFVYAHPKNYDPKSSKPLVTSPVLLPQSSLSTETFIFLSSKDMQIKKKIEAIGTLLKDWDISINYGIKTSYNEAFIISSQKREEILNACANDEERNCTEKLIGPILRGKDIKRYSYEWKDCWIILAKFDSHKYLEKDYPAIYNHLLHYEGKLQSRGQCRYVRGKESTNKGYLGQHHWLELNNNPKDAYLELFAKEKIVYSKIVQSRNFI